MESKDNVTIENTEEYKTKINEIVYLPVIKLICKNTPNDMELGSKIRKLINSLK